jgi:predicted AAA+ superfamily ATPase
MTKYWNINKALSYNASIVLVAGARSIGKTYTTLKHCVKRFIKHGEECVYIRRYEPELKAVKKYVFSDVATDKEFKDYVFRLVGMEYQIAKRPNTPIIHTKNTSIKTSNKLRTINYS